ncbi:MAG: pyridoxamine 5'-phosphate oxidase [Chitinophagaceae bacterium]|nr:MAG: pyridoxamine 5'-phosphate oxidase [Chitinophagaceae bacterium]
MKTAALSTLAQKMKNLDFCMMVTQDGHHGYHSRPMSNNGEVEYDGNSWFFTYDDSAKVKHIEADAKVSLIYQTDKMLFIECYGRASIIKQKAVMAEKWIDELSRWFPEGLETPGICLIKVTATRIRYWDKEGEGEYKPA